MSGEGSVADEAMERIELKIAFLESAVQDLSDTVYRQQREIEALQGQLALSQRLLEALKSDLPPAGAEDERPPHY
jgi:uncharacterized coiled-coil protein SlyX